MVSHHSDSPPLSKQLRHSIIHTMKSSIASCIFITLLVVGAQANRVIEQKERHLGPTGMFGVTSPKDIHIVKIEPGSPADGKIKPGDVITAAGGVSFTGDTRKQLATAIDHAEATGTLTLTLDGDSTVEISLPAIGSYSATAPFDCAKTDAIITRAADFLVESRKFGRENLPIALLGLLATGEEGYIDFVKQSVHEAPWASPDLELSIDTYARTAWSWGYIGIFLGEYYLLTKDDHVLPAIEAYAVAIATGRDAGGLWGHGFASLDLNDGQRNGRLPGYAQMNQSSLPMFLALLLAEKCGVRHPEVLAAIEQNNTYFSSFIGRGTLPYGVHDPNVKSFNNNGMSGLTAVAFALHENQTGAEFFSRMSAASHNTIETGHTGHFFNQLWTGPGAHIAGPETTTAFFRETRWLHTMNRKWNGDFTYDCNTSSNANFSYRNLSDAGSHLINHSLGRRALFITGRDADESLWQTAPDAEANIALAFLDLENAGDNELLGYFGHPMPKIRQAAVWTLRAREHALGSAIHAMISDGTDDQRASAIAYFGHGCPPEKADTAKDSLIRLLRDPAESPDLRAAAASSLSHRGEDAHHVYADILRLVVEEKPDDPLQLINQSLGTSLRTVAPHPYAAGLVTDKDLFYQAVDRLLAHPRANGRSSAMAMIEHMPVEDFHRVGKEIAAIMVDKNRSYHSYHNLGPRNGAMSIFAHLGIEGGIEAAFAVFEEETGKYGFKVRMIMDVLPKYGADAKPWLPKLREMHPGPGRFARPWDRMIEAIESAPPSEREPLTFEEVMGMTTDG